MLSRLTVEENTTKLSRKRAEGYYKEAFVLAIRRKPIWSKNKDDTRNFLKGYIYDKIK